MSDRPHGYARYKLDGCRCHTCRRAVSTYNDRRIRLMIAGRWDPYVDPAAAQFHVLALGDLGFGQRHIAKLAGVERKTIRDLAAGFRHEPKRGNPPLTRIRKETAAAILAIPYNQLQADAGARIDATLTWQRVEEIQAAGYTAGWISAQIGQDGRRLQLGRTRVTARNARAIADLHKRVCGPQVRHITPSPRPNDVRRPRRTIVTAEEILASIGREGVTR